MLELEFEQLKVQNLDAFESSQSTKNDLLQKLMQLAHIDGPESANALGTEWDEFKEHMALCRDMHRRNEVLISRKIDAIRGALQSLNVFDPTSSVEMYDRLGKLSRVSSWQRLRRSLISLQDLSLRLAKLIKRLF
jgi:flagellar biosynthesis/type III secretory pathway chaperone